jgi:hypothetical protein
VKVSLDGPPQRPASGERPIPSTPPRVGAPGDSMRPRAIRVGARRGRVPNPVRVALLGVAVAALGLVAAGRIELPTRQNVAPPSAQPAKPAPRHAAKAAPAPRPVAAEAAAPVELAPVALAVASPQVEIARVAPVHVAAADPVSAPVEPAALEAPVESAALEVPVETAAVEAPIEMAAPESPPVQAEPRARTVRVSLNADPWAHIAIDGRDVGVTPMADLELTEGPHRFRARFPDGRVMERTLRVDAVRDHLSFP